MKQAIGSNSVDAIGVVKANIAQSLLALRCLELYRRFNSESDFLISSEGIFESSNQTWRKYSRYPAITTPSTASSTAVPMARRDGDVLGISPRCSRNILSL